MKKILSILLLSFAFAYEFQAYNSDPDYDEEAIWEQAKRIYLKANPGYLFGERHPMIPEGYDYVTEARIGWPLNWPGLKKEKYFEYKAE